jgi:hypothetical protein
MEATPVRAVPALGVDPLVLGLLRRLAGEGRDQFLPEVPDAELPSVLGCYPRLACREGFFQVSVTAA